MKIEDKIIESKRGIIDKIKVEKRILSEQLKNDLSNGIDNKNIKEFLNFLNITDKSKLIAEKNGKKLFNNKEYGKSLNNFCNERYNFENVQNEFDLKNLENQYFAEVKNVINTIKDWEYRVGTELKNLCFVGDINNLKDLDELKNFFDENGYKVEEIHIDFNELLELSKVDDTFKLYQIKSKDLKFHPNFVVEGNIGKPETALNNKKLENSNKDLNTIYFERFFEDFVQGNKRVRIGADLKIRQKNAEIKSDYSNFWEKKKNQRRHLYNKKNIENFGNRYKRNQKFVAFNILLNPINHKTSDELNEIVENRLKEKIKNNESIKILSLDHGESSFLAYKILEFKFENGKIVEIKEDKKGNLDDVKLTFKGNSNNKKQVLITGKQRTIDDILENYITKYHLMIQDQKRVNQVQETLKNFANVAIGQIKQAISSNKNIDEIENLVHCLIDKNSDAENNIFKLLLKNKFNYDKYEFSNDFPDQKNLKEGIDSYVTLIRNLVNSEKDLQKFYNEIKSTFDGKSIPDSERLHKVPFYQFGSFFDTNIKNILNLKKGYSSVLISAIKEKILNGDIDIIGVEDNIITEGQFGTEMKYFGTANHPVFLQGLINKLGCIIEKNDDKKNMYQFAYIEKQSNYNKYKDNHNGVIYFVNEDNTSKKCPKCGENLIREKEGGDDKLYHKDTSKCNFLIQKSINKAETYKGTTFKDGEDVACFNIAYEVIKNFFLM